MLCLQLCALQNAVALVGQHIGRPPVGIRLSGFQIIREKRSGHHGIEMSAGHGCGRLEGSVLIAIDDSRFHRLLNGCTRPVGSGHIPERAGLASCGSAVCIRNRCIRLRGILRGILAGIPGGILRCRSPAEEIYLVSKIVHSLSVFRFQAADAHCVGSIVAGDAIGPEYDTVADAVAGEIHVEVAVTAAGAHRPGLAVTLPGHSHGNAGQFGSVILLRIQRHTPCSAASEQFRGETAGGGPADEIIVTAASAPIKYFFYCIVTSSSEANFAHCWIQLPAAVPQTVDIAGIAVIHKAVHSSGQSAAA